MKSLLLRAGTLVPLAFVVACDGAESEATPSRGSASSATPSADARPDPSGPDPRAAERAWFESTGERVEIATVGLSIERPAGFEVARGEGYDGLTAPDHGSAIVVARVPGSFASRVGGYTAEALAARGTTVLSTDEREIAGLPGLVHHGTSASDDLVIRRLLLFFGDEDGSYLVTVNTPEDLWPAVGEDLAAVAFGVERVERRLPDAPPFALGDPGPLVEQLSTTGRMFVEEGELEPGAVAARFLAGTSRSQVAIDDRAAFLRARLEKLSMIGELEGDSAGLVIANRPAERFVGSYRDTTTGDAMVVHATLVVEPDARYVFLLGTVDAARRAEFEPVFTALGDGFARP